MDPLNHSLLKGRDTKPLTFFHNFCDFQKKVSQDSPAKKQPRSPTTHPLYLSICLLSACLSLICLPVTHLPVCLSPPCLSFKCLPGSSLTGSLASDCASLLYLPVSFNFPTHYLPPTTYYLLLLLLLPTIYYLVPTTYYLLPTTYYALNATAAMQML